jgi:peroxiredoxin
LRGGGSLGGVLAPGDPLPDVALVTPAGAAVSSARFRGEATVLVFLRHLG